MSDTDSSSSVSADSIWLVLSSALMLIAIIVLWRKQLLYRYWVEATGLAVAVWQSVVYHACYASDIRWCPAESPAVLHGLDVMAAQLGLVWLVTPFIDQYMVDGDWFWRPIYGACATLLTHILVTMFTDNGIAASMTITALNICVLGFILVRRVPTYHRTWFWWLRFSAAACISIFALVAYILDEGIWHARWHAAGAAGVSIAYSLLLSDKDRRAHAVAMVDRSNDTTTKLALQPYKEVAPGSV